MSRTIMVVDDEPDILISIGHAVGGLIEICYTKWFKPKPIYVIKDIVTEGLKSYTYLKLENGQIRSLADSFGDLKIS